MSVLECGLVVVVVDAAAVDATAAAGDRQPKMSQSCAIQCLHEHLLLAYEGVEPQRFSLLFFSVRFKG